MRAEIQKVGDRLVLRIPEPMGKQLKLEDGMVVDLEFEDGEFRVAPAKPRKYTLDQMVEGITEESLHGEISTGEPQGREIW